MICTEARLDEVNTQITNGLTMFGLAAGAVIVAHIASKLCSSSSEDFITEEDPYLSELWEVMYNFFMGDNSTHLDA